MPLTSEPIVGVKVSYLITCGQEVGETRVGVFAAINVFIRLDRVYFSPWSQVGR
jgi:hypothetical protein